MGLGSGARPACGNQVSKCDTAHSDGEKGRTTLRKVVPASDTSLFCPRNKLETPATSGVVPRHCAFYSFGALTPASRSQKELVAPGLLLRTQPVHLDDPVGPTENRKPSMSEPFRPYEKLVDITIFGKKFQVPERNSLLRCFQFISPETIPYGRFCWNQDCQYCRVTCQLPDDDEPREMLSCKFIVMPGMEVLEMSQELKWCLRSKLPADAPVSS